MTLDGSSVPGLQCFHILLLFFSHTYARVGAFPTSIKSLWNSNLSQLKRSHTWAVTSFGLPTIILLVWRGVPLHLRQYWVQEVGCKDQWSLLGWQHPDKTLSQTGQPSYTWKEESLQKELQRSGQHFKAEPTTCAKSTPNRCAVHRERRIPQESLCNVKEKRDFNHTTNLISTNTAARRTVKHLNIYTHSKAPQRYTCSTNRCAWEPCDMTAVGAVWSQLSQPDRLLF